MTNHSLRSRSIRTVIIVMFVLLALPSTALAAQSPIADLPHVQVSGAGNASATADTARSNLSVASTAPTAAAATSENAATTQRVIDALTSVGVAADDLQTGNIALYPQIGQNPNTITGYQAVVGLEVVLRDLTKAGATLDAAVAAGGNALRIDRVTFELSDNSTLLTKARAAAVADAKLKAAQYAALTGSTLGRVLSITEQSSSAPPSGLPVTTGAPAPVPATPIRPGDVHVTVTVEIVWALETGASPQGP
jgi:uncharacterized protein